MAIPNQTAVSAAKTTANGTAYTEYYVTPPASGDPMLVLVPNSVGEGSPAKLTLFLHGRTGTETQINGGNRISMRNALLDAGHIIAAPYLHGDSWGNRTAQNDMGAIHSWASAVWQVSSTFLIGESMSGNAATIAVKLKELPINGVVLLSPSLNLQRVWDRGNAGHDGLETAFNVPSTGAGFADATAAWDTVRQPASDFTGVHLRVYASPDDTVISMSGDVVPFVDRVKTVSNDVQLITVTGGHTSADTYRPSEIVAFFAGLTVATGSNPVQRVKAWDGSNWVEVRSVKAWTQTGWRVANLTAYKTD